MKKNLYAALVVMLLAALAATAQTNTLTIPDVWVEKGKSMELPVNMDNTADVVAVQFTLTVPDGVTLYPDAAVMSERSDGHVVTVKKTGDSQYMAMIFSPENKPVPGRTGKLMSVRIVASESLEDGAELPFALKDVVLSGRDGTNVVTDYSAGTLIIQTSADLELTGVTSNKMNVVPGGNISVGWQVANVGGLPTKGGWSEKVYLDASDGTSKLIGTVYYDNTLGVGATVSRSAEFTVPAVPGLDGNATVRVRLTPNADAGEPSWLQGNNESASASRVFVDKLLSLNPQSVSVDESANGSARFLLTRSGSTASAETFALQATADSRVILPAEVTIGKGQSAVYFYAQVKSNGVLDAEGDTLVNLTLSGNGYPEAAARIAIADDTWPSLSISSAAQDVVEGGTIVFTVTTGRAPKSDLPITLSCDLPARFKIPSPVFIPAGQTSVDVTVTAVDDNVPDVEQVVTFSVSAEKHNAASMNTVLLDDDVPALQIALEPDAVSESAGPLAVSARLSRTSNIDKAVTVKLSDDSDGAIYYQRQTVEMAAGVEELVVNLGPIDNAIVDGERTYNIAAAVYIASCSCNANSGTSGGKVSAPLTVYDDDGPALSLSSSSSVLTEGGEITITLKRNTETSSALSVSLSSNHDAELDYPATVTIPAGTASVTFTVKSRNNDTTGDGFTAVLTAEAEGFAKSNVFFSVSDQTLPDARIAAFSVSETEAVVGSVVTANVTVENAGSYELPEMTKVGIYLGDGSSPCATIYMQEALAPGASIELSREITLPQAVGSYRAYAVANDGQAVKELLYSNNMSAVLTVKTLSPFSTSVQTDKSIYRQGETVGISGQVKGTGVAGKSVEVYVINGGYRHVVPDVTASVDGTFSVAYTPYAGQMGHFVVGACYPGEGLNTEQAAFDIYGMKRTSTEAITCEAIVNEPYSGSVKIVNPGVLPLSGVKATVLSKPETCVVDIVCPDNIGGGNTVELKYSIVGSAVSPGDDWEQIKINVESAEGASLPLTLYYYCRNPKGQLQANVSNINTTMTKGQSRDYPITIANIGNGETGRITLALPQWMTTATPREIASLAHGENSSVVLRLTPTDDMQLNVPVTGTIGINCENGDGLSLGYRIEPVSETTGTLVVDVCDEYTYYTAEAPHVAGAQVLVKHPTTGAVIAQGQTNGNGLYSVSLPEGYYSLSVTADKHDSYKNNILVDPGVETKETINLSFRAIEIDWRVEETEVEDEYDISTTVKYETNAPMPIVELSVPASIPAKELESGESLVFYAVLTNRGLITAQDVELDLPSGFKALSFETMSYNDGPFDLAPQQSVTIPVKVTNISDIIADVVRRVKPIDDDPCASQVGTLYFWDCGNDRKWHRYNVALQLGTCKSDDPNTWENSGDDYYGDGDKPFLGWPFGGGGFNSVPKTSPNGTDVFKYGSSIEKNPFSQIEDEGCEPCQNSFMLDLIKCASRFIPYLGQAITATEQIVNGVKCLNSFTSTHDIVSKVKECPFTEEFAEVVDMLMPLYELGSDLVNGKFVKSVDQEGTSDNIVVDSDALNKRITEVMDDFFKRLAQEYGVPTDDSTVDWMEELKQLCPEAETVIDKLEGVESSYAKLNSTDRTRVSEVTEATLQLFKSVGDLLLHSKMTEKIGKSMTKTVGKLEKYLCILKLIDYECDKEGASDVQRLKPYRIQGLSNSAIDAFVEAADHYVSVFEANDRIRQEVCGDSIWLSVTLDEFIPLYYYLTNTDKVTYSDLLYILKPEKISYSQFDAFVKRWNTLSDTENGYENMLDVEGIKMQCERVDKAMDYLETTEYPTLSSLLQAKYEDVINDESINSVCASISLRLSQTVAMTRQAFRGTLTVFNGNEENIMDNVRLNLEVRDEAGKLATSHELQINLESLDGFAGELNLNSGWSLGAGDTGTATVVFIPTKYAALESEQKYSFGGRLSYVDPYTGLEVTRELTPVTLTVKPSPNLELTYFMQRDIFGDDPLTEDVVEPCVPAEFAFVINNNGYGDATNVRMVTNQPQIVDNEKGLLIDFELLSSQLNGKDNTLALGNAIASDFGTIPAHSSTYAQWWLRSTLLGHFTNYDVKATHVTSYGNDDLSLLDTVTIHELIHGFTVEAGGDVPTRGFLVNDLPDADDQPDMVYFSNGRDEEGVSVAAGVRVEQRSNIEYAVTLVPSAMGWNYTSTTGLLPGRANLVSVVRQSDGKELPTDNFWLTDRTLRDGKDPLYETRLHAVAELSGEETYVLSFEPRPETELEVTGFTGLPANGVLTSQLKSIGVTFNKPVNAVTFTAADITLACQGKAVDVSRATVSKVTDTEFTIGLDNVTLSDGYYVLTVQTAAIADLEGYSGTVGKSASWTQFVDGMVAISVKALPEEGGTVTPAGGRFAYGSDITLKAVPAEGYDFSGWQHDGTSVTDKATYVCTVTSDGTFTALFTIKHFSVGIDFDSILGVVEGAATGIYDYGTVLEMTARPYADNRFDGWYAGGELLGLEPECRFTVKDDIVIRAAFSSGDPDGIAGTSCPGRDFSISPLPLRDVVYIDGDFSIVERLSIVDTSGAVHVVKERLPRGSALDVLSLPQGIYIIRAVTDNGIYIRKVFKK